MSFCVHGSVVVLCNNERVVIYDLQTEKETTISLSDLDQSKTDKKSDVQEKIDAEEFHSITNVSFSKTGKYFLVCTNRKLLYLFDAKSKSLSSSRSVPRAASKARFAPNDDIIVADKSGDAYLFSTNKPTEKGILLLGHSSMLLDVLVTNDSRYIVTTDRDEKIRVSMYPNAYNILSYCLGHRKFVTNVMELPHDRSVLISSGGDGVFILWDYKSGMELLRTDFSGNVSQQDVSEFRRGLKEFHPEESIETLPIKQMRSTLLEKESSLIVLNFYHSKTVLSYVINGTRSENNMEAKYVGFIEAEEEPLECLLDGNNLWILTDFGLKIYRYESNGFVIDNILNDKLKSLNSQWESLKKLSTIQQNLFPILYKRKYDNVQEYLERKKSRLGNAGE